MAMRVDPPHLAYCTDEQIYIIDYLNETLGQVGLVNHTCTSLTASASRFYYSTHGASL